MKIVIPVKPVPKGRPRFGNGHAYTPKTTRDFEETVQLIARASIKKPLEKAVKLIMMFYMPIPKSWTKSKKNEAVKGVIRPASKPDIDNLEKAVMDALNGGIGYDDDRLVVEKHTYEFYSDEPRIEIELEEVK